MLATLLLAVAGQPAAAQQASPTTPTQAAVHAGVVQALPDCRSALDDAVQAGECLSRIRQDPVARSPDAARVCAAARRWWAPVTGPRSDGAAAADLDEASLLLDDGPHTRVRALWMPGNHSDEDFQKLVRCLRSSGFELRRVRQLMQTGELRTARWVAAGIELTRTRLSSPDGDLVGFARLR